MAVTIGNARISERGTVNGTKGDQTGREVMTQSWSTGGTWTYVIRPKSATVASKIASAMKAACANNNIGYSQADRLSLYKLASKNGYKLDKVGKCNCDCSSLVAVCVNAAGIKISPSMYTGNELAVLKGTGKFTVYTSSDYTKKSSKLRTGDILLRPGHTAIVTSGAVPLIAASAPAKKATKPAANKTAKKSIAAVAQDVLNGKYGNGSTRVAKLKKAGYTTAEITQIQKKVNQLASSSRITNAAKAVIAGKYGNGSTRTAKLRKAGYTPKEIAQIQAKVNQLCR